MPFREPDSREAAGQKGRDYADAVTDFMNARGYMLESRAEDSGEPEDLVFLPKAGNRRPVVAEAKYRKEKTAFSPNDYKEGFGERFKQWESGTYRDYQFYLFISNVSNKALWKKLFHSIDSDEIDSFFNKIQDAATGELKTYLDQHDSSLFEDFAQNVVVWGGYTIADLTRISDRAGESGEYDFNPYLESYEPIHERGTLKVNLFEITTLPEHIYRITTVSGTNTRSFYRHKDNQALPVTLHGGDVFSLLPPDDLPEATTDFCNLDEAEMISFRDWADSDPSEERVDTAKTLLKGLLVLSGKENNALVTRKRNDTRLYMPWGGGADVSIHNRWVAQQLDKTPEVQHRAIVIHVKRLAERYYYLLVPKKEFTSDGRTLTSGKRKKELSASFSESRYPQNRRKSKNVDAWASILSNTESLMRFNLPKPLQELEWQRAETMVLPNVRPPKDGAERKALIDQKLGKQSQLD